MKNEGAALSVESNLGLAQWHNVPNSVPHITLFVNKKFEAKDLKVTYDPNFGSAQFGPLCKGGSSEENKATGVLVTILISNGR